MSNSLYRKYRPKNFEELAGQEAIVNSLKNQIETGNIFHSYLFCGGRGTGKTSSAKIFAKAINCENHSKGNPCGKCENCKQTETENLDIIEIDAASNNGVDKIRDLIENVKFLPFKSKYKVYIIDEVHMLSEGAFNAFLKTLEEPPKHVVFILATTEVQKLPATILSRCFRFNFKPPESKVISQLLQKLCDKEGIKYSAEVIDLISEVAEGSFRDGLSILDGVISFSGSADDLAKTTEIVGAINKKDIEALAEAILTGDDKLFVTKTNELFNYGKGVHNILKELLVYFKALKLSGNKTEKLSKVLEVLYRLELEIKNTLNPKLIFEAAVLSIV